MFVVIVGDMALTSDGDRTRVWNLIEQLKMKYADLVIVSAGCDKGIGKFVRDRCVKQTDGVGKPKRDVGFVEIAVYPWANMSSARLAQVYLCKNAALVDLGEEFHIFTLVGREYGHIQDLVERVRNAEHQPPLTVYT